MTSQKKKTLNNVVNTFDIQKNLIFFLLPTKNGFSLIHESNEFDLTNTMRCIWVRDIYVMSY